MLSLSLTVLLPLTAARPARAGSWLFTVSGTMTVISQPGNPPAYSVPTQATDSYSLPTDNNLYFSTSGAFPPGTVIASAQSFQLPLTISAVWVPNPQLPADPAPAVARFLELGSVGYAAIASSTGPASASGAADDGFGDTPVLSSGGYVSSGGIIHQCAVVNGRIAPWTRTLSASATGSISVPTGMQGGGILTTYAQLNSFSLQAQHIAATLTVDQDQQVLAPAATEHFSATVNNSSGFTVDWVKISVDNGTPIAATMTVGNPNNYYVNWPSSAALNPSEHTVTATAQIHDIVGPVPLDSTRPEGNGRPADDIIANIVPKSIDFGSLPLNQDTTTPVPTPQITWDSNGNRTPNYSGGFAPAAYIRTTTPVLGLALYNATGGATIGFTLDLKASPNTADPSLALYETGSTPQPFGSHNYYLFSTQASLYNYVAYYNSFIRDLRFYVQFTKTGVPASQAPWQMVNNYASSSNVIANTIYGLLATPTTPMTTPWARVLDYACLWAGGDSTPTTATTALATGLYNNGTYNGGNPAFTSSFLDGYEIFHLKSYLASSTPYPLYGQCDDFSDFLVCLSNAVGARPIKAQRSATVAEILSGSHFYTNPITASHQQNSGNAAPIPGGWAYHQWTNDTTLFDGCQRFGGTTTPADMPGPALGSVYNTDLVASYLHSLNPVADWDPQLPFGPTIAN